MKSGDYQDKPTARPWGREVAEAVDVAEAAGAAEAAKAADMMVLRCGSGNRSGRADINLEK